MRESMDMNNLVQEGVQRGEGGGCEDGNEPSGSVKVGETSSPFE